jgi:hypothetical protein
MARGRTRKNTANAAPAKAPARRGRGNNKPQVAFAYKLALNQWLLSLFHVKRRFIEDLTAFHDRDSDFFQGSELYLLRNLSKGRGVGFFEAGNFHPDFILWLLIGNQQRVLFVDPKGIRNFGPTDPKIQFFQTVKEIEQRLDDPNVRLESFIVSNTPSHTMKLLWSMPKTEMQSRHILFQEEDQDTYIRTMLEHAR